jgi:hypothetical protein
MDYTLAVLTHGGSRTLDATLRSFIDKVKPHPARIIVYADGPVTTWHSPMPPHTLVVAERQRGFCHATGRLWHWASDPDVEATEFTFWLEHDFVFLRPVDLADLATVLSDDKTLAQMQLMRTPVSREEIAAGGLFESRPDQYEPILAVHATSPEGPRWLRHRSYFTTNPSLMRTEFMTWNQWPDDGEPSCEGRFSIDLLQRGFSYGVWGSGEPWVEHTGRRDGFGY